LEKYFCKIRHHTSFVAEFLAVTTWLYIIEYGQMSNYSLTGIRLSPFLGIHKISHG